MPRRRNDAFKLKALCVFTILLFSLFVNSPALAGDIARTPDSVTTAANAAQETLSEQPRPIQDNSFLVEEAYNQEFGVVQHINTFSRSWNTHQWIYTFTQEWPAPGQAHQLSYTMSYLNNGASRVSNGIGDFALNYRYQLIGSGETRVAVAPRLTLLLPTGSSRMGRGFGGAGIQTNVPLSWVVAKHLVTHWNAGATMVPSARNEVGYHATATGYNLGQSLVWLVRPLFNAMLETTWTGSESVIAEGRTRRSNDLQLSPGIRWAHNFSNGLQIVPGVAVPFGFGPSAGERGVFVYLSFEHPFRALR